MVKSSSKNNKFSHIRNGKWGITSFLVFFISIISVLSLGSCHDGKEIKPKEIMPDSTDMCVIVYMAAENSLSKIADHSTNQTFAEKDIKEMIKVSADIPLTCRLIVYLDSPKLPQLFEINRLQGKVSLQTRVEEDSADPVTFENILHHIATQYPSRHHGLVLWSHASGWIPPRRKTFGIDNLTNSKEIDKGSEMEIADLHRALDNLNRDLNVYFDYIMFDACFMQCIETAYELRNNTDYIIASPAEIPGDGAPYNLIMKQLMNPSEENCKLIIEKYYQSYLYGSGSVLSLIKTSELESLLSLTKKLCPDFYTRSYELNTSYIQPYCGFMSLTSWKPEYFDMASVMNRLLAESDYQEWLNQLERTVILRRNTDRWMSIYSCWDFYPVIIDPNHLALASIFVPNSKYDYNTNYNEAIKQTLWYKDFTK